jgi:hypothetical protein
MAVLVQSGISALVTPMHGTHFLLTMVSCGEAPSPGLRTARETAPTASLNGLP